jgi:hypothetical protein
VRRSTGPTPEAGRYPKHRVPLTGNAAKLRTGDVERGRNTAAAIDSGYSFMVVEIAGRELYFQTVSRTGRICRFWHRVRPGY